MDPQQNYGYPQEPYQAPAGYQPPPPPRRKHIALRILGGIVGLLVVIIVIAGVAGGNKPSPATPSTSGIQQSVVPVTSAAPTGPSSSIGDGTYVVGTDITAGTWKTTGGGDGACGWQRLSATDGDFSSIIADGVATGPTTVTVKSSDKAFATLGGCNWARIGN